MVIAFTMIGMLACGDKQCYAMHHLLLSTMSHCEAAHDYKQLEHVW